MEMFIPACPPIVCLNNCLRSMKKAYKWWLGHDFWHEFICWFAVDEIGWLWWWMCDGKGKKKFPLGGFLWGPPSHWRPRFGFTSQQIYLLVLTQSRKTICLGTGKPHSRPTHSTPIEHHCRFSPRSTKPPCACPLCMLFFLSVWERLPPEQNTLRWIMNSTWYQVLDMESWSSSQVWDG